MSQRKLLWYESAAAIWEEALPLGNGRIGAMVYSGAISDKIQLNEDTLWSGYPNKETRKHNMEELTQIRQLVKEKKYAKAQEETQNSMFGVHSDAYVPYGHLYVDILASQSRVTDYRRELDLDNSIVRTSYKLNGVPVEKEVFVSLRDDVLVVHIKSEKGQNLHIYQAVDLESSVRSADGVITAQGRCPTDVSTYTNTVTYDETKESIHFCSRIKAITEGGQYFGGNGIWITNACEATIIFSIKTSFHGYNKMPVSEGNEYTDASLKTLEKAENYTYAELKERHIKEYKKYFDRVELEIEGADYSNIPTDVRIHNAASGTVDNQLVTLLFDYGRYLTISASAEGTQPMNLQGIWNQHMIAPWHSNYTMNINTQMNYWPTETVNLPECHMPLLKMTKEFCEKGNNFNLNGWASWHNSDIWRFNYEATKTATWGYWPMGGFWTARHIWEHYIHTKDVGFLKEYYPVMTGAADFLMDWLYENEKGELTTCPSTSSENSFLADGERCAVCEGSAMDMSISYDLFDKLIKAGEILGEETEKYQEIRSKLKPVKIGKDGRILEWGEELEESEMGHRHISHLYGFFPSDIMTDETYTDAVRETLRVRLLNGGGHTGWSNAWIANVYARLGDGEKVMYHIRNMFKKSIYPNMFDAHPPFQIDGNFGIMSAICEALMQSHKGEIEFLPALPGEWKAGSVRGFVARTGETVNFKWKDGKVIKE